MKNKKNRKGFTIAEVLISMTILGLAAAGILSILGSSVEWNDPSINMAYNVARGRVEELQREVRASTWELMNQPLTPNSTTNDTALGLARQTVVADRITGRNERAGGTVEERYRKVTVRVTTS